MNAFNMLGAMMQKPSFAKTFAVAETITVGTFSYGYVVTTHGTSSNNNSAFTEIGVTFPIYPNVGSITIGAKQAVAGSYGAIANYNGIILGYITISATSVAISFTRNCTFHGIVVAFV